MLGIRWRNPAATDPAAGAGRPGPGWRGLARLWDHPVTLAAAVTVAGAAAWLMFFPRVGTDLSAGIVRAGWAARYPGSAYLFSWYGGFSPAGYSLAAPYLLTAGVWPLIAAAVVISAGRLAWRLYCGDHPNE